MTRVIIIHGWTGKPESNWFPWLRDELTQRSIAVSMPQFPPDNEPSMDEWLATLTAAIADDPDVVLVGHSLGVITILRSLERHTVRVAGAALVAGFARAIDIPELRDFFRTPVDFKAVREHCPAFRVMNSDNDPYVPLAEGEFLAMQLRTPLIIAHGKRHLSSETAQYPPILNAVLSLLEA